MKIFFVDKNWPIIELNEKYWGQNWLSIELKKKNYDKNWRIIELNEKKLGKNWLSIELKKKNDDENWIEIELTLKKPAQTTLAPGDGTRKKTHWEFYN